MDKKKIQKKQVKSNPNEENDIAETIRTMKYIETEIWFSTLKSIDAINT